MFHSNLLLQHMQNMFQYCHAITELDLSTFDTRSVSPNNMSFLFSQCESLEKIYVSSTWDASNQPNFMPIFGNNTSLVGGNGTVYDNTQNDKNMAIIDGTNNQLGYLTNIADKPNN